MLGGLPAAATSQEPDLHLLFFRWLTPFWAYVTGDLAVRCLGFVGMLALLLSVSSGTSVLAGLVAFAFAMLPFYSVTGASIAGQPALALAILTLARGTPRLAPRVAALAYCLIFATWSCLPLVGVHLAGVLGLVWLIDVRQHRRVNPWLTAGIVLLGLGYVGANYKLLESMVSAERISWHRDEFIFQRVRDLRFQLKEGIKLALMSHYHADANSFPILWAGLLLALGAGVREAGRRCPGPAWSDSWSTLKCDRELLLAAGAVCFATAVGASYFAWLDPLYGSLEAHFPPIKGFNVSRFYFFLPLVSYVGLHAALVSLQRLGRATALLSIALALGQLALNVEAREWREKERPLYVRYSDFVNRSVFDRVEALMGCPRGSTRVGCVGLSPAAAMLNGFTTVDGYWYLYPLEYKHRFRKVIARELEKSRELRDYFDNWGSRCYIFSAELGKRYLFPRNDGRSIDRLDIDVAALKDLGARYLLSGVPIRNAPELGLKDLGTAFVETSPVEVHVYFLP
jgi:hypothetical protein